MRNNRRDNGPMAKVIHIIGYGRIYPPQRFTQIVAGFAAEMLLTGNLLKHTMHRKGLSVIARMGKAQTLQLSRNRLSNTEDAGRAFSGSRGERGG